MNLFTYSIYINIYEQASISYFLYFISLYNLIFLSLLFSFSSSIEFSFIKFMCINVVGLSSILISSSHVIRTFNLLSSLNYFIFLTLLFNFSYYSLFIYLYLILYSLSSYIFIYYINFNFNSISNISSFTLYQLAYLSMSGFPLCLLFVAKFKLMFILFYSISFSILIIFIFIYFISLINYFKLALLYTSISIYSHKSYISHLSYFIVSISIIIFFDLSLLDVC
jgi:hypothetical protein